MLSDANVRILQYVKENGNIVFSDELPDFFTPVRAEHLVELGFLHYACNSSGFGIYQLLPAGEDALSASADEKRRSTDQEEYARLQNQLQDKRWRKDALRSWVQWAITTILSIATFFAGAMIEKHTGFMDWIISLFH